MSKTTEALKLALETAEAIVAANWKTWEELATPEEFERWAKSRANHMVAVIREALAQPVKQEPMAFADKYGNLYSVAGKLALELECLLLDTEDLSVVSKWWDSAHDALEQWRSIKDTAPVERQWVDLTDDEIWEAVKNWNLKERVEGNYSLTRAVIAKFKEKNR